MPSMDVLSQLEELFSPEECTTLLSALRRDPLVWASLEQPEFLAAAVERSGNQLSMWSPGQLALLSLKSLRGQEAVRTDALDAPGRGLAEKALQAYQAVQRSGNEPADLREAGLLALALRERRRLTGSWNGLLNEIRPRTPQAEGLFAIWRTPIACLYGMVNDPDDMLRSLLPRKAFRAPFEWITHARLSQPANESAHIEAFQKILTGVPVAYQLGLLRSMSLHGAETLAAQLANQLLVSHPAFENLRTPAGPNDYDLASLTARALAMQQMGAFYQLAGDPSQALALFTAAEKVLSQWLSGLFLQRMNLGYSQSGLDTTEFMTSEQISHLAASAGWLKNELGAVLANHPFANSVLEQISTSPEGGYLQITRARQMFEREPALARVLARQGTTSLLEEMRREGLPFAGEYIYIWHAQDVLKILLDIGLPDEALALVQNYLKVRPSDNHLLEMSSQLNARLGQLDAAVQDAKQLVILNPEKLEWQRWLASLLSQAESWEQAFVQWQVVLRMDDTPSAADRLSCGQSALQSGHLDEVIQIAQDLLLEDPNQGPAMGLMGQALVAQGDTDQAISFLGRATLLSPEVLDPWMTLARVQRTQGETDRALETLKAAVAAVPDAPEALLALGLALEEKGFLAEALPHLKKAFTLAPEMDGIALAFSRTLRALGHTGEARTALERVHTSLEKDPALGYEYAQVLLDLNDAEAALPVLEAALKAGLSDINEYLLYARVLLGEYRNSEEAWDAEVTSTRMQQAEEALRNILSIEPNSLEARFLMADILREKGELNQALEVYQELANLNDRQRLTQEQRWRVQWGIGRTAMRMGDINTAMVALKEAVVLRPDSFAFQRALADASLKANLPREALLAADATLKLAPGDLENLAWYAKFTADMGETEKAVTAVEQAVQIDSERASLRIALAELQLSAGNLEETRKTLEALENLDTSWMELRRAAHVWARLQEPRKALHMYDMAFTLGGEIPGDLYYEAGQLHEHLGSYEKALDLVQKALELSPTSLPFYLLQADLLARMSRPQAAVATLERALRVAESEGKMESHAAGDVFDRFARLMIQEGNLPSALQYAEKALALNPERAGLRYRAADLALALLQMEHAARMILPASAVVPGATGRLIDQGQEGIDMLCLQIEQALLNRQLDEAGRWIEAGLSRASESGRLIVAKARLLAQRGRVADARQTLVALASSAKRDQAIQSTLWYADAALETRLWKEALSAYHLYTIAHPGEARAHLGYARALTITAEYQHICDAVNSQAAAPGVSALSEENRLAFEEAIRNAGRIASATEIDRWQARGQAAFSPSTQNTRTLAAMPAAPDDTAALVGTLRLLKNQSMAIQVARRHADANEVQLQVALCYMGAPGAEALMAARRAAASNPMEPSAFAAQGCIARQAGELEEALEAYKQALQLSPDEPVWNDAAGDLCIETGQLDDSLAYRRIAYQLIPGNSHYAYKLGLSCLENEANDEAIGYLEQAIQVDENIAEHWLALAKAYYQVDRLSEALDAAKRASSLLPSSAEGLLIAGETAQAMDRADLAMEFAKEAVQREPENPAAMLFLSNVLVKQDKVNDALAVLEGASSVVKASFPVAFERARLIRQIHGPQAALETLDKLAREHPDQPELLSYLAQTQSECGETKAAERTAFKSLRLDPNQPDIALMLGRIQRKTGQLDQAVHLLSEAIRIAPENLDNYLELAGVYQDRQEFAQALQVYRQAMRTSPGNYQAYYQSGIILRDSKDYAASEVMLRKAAELAPDNPSIRRQLVGVIALNLVHQSNQEVSSL